MSAGSVAVEIVGALVSTILAAREAASESEREAMDEQIARLKARPQRDLAVSTAAKVAEAHAEIARRRSERENGGGE